MHSGTTLRSKRVIDRPEYYSRYGGETDEFGFNSQIVAQWQPFFQFLYKDYFQVQTIGLEHIPHEGRAVLVGNHAGMLPMDAFMTHTAVFLHHESPRRIRCLTHQFLHSNSLVKTLITGFGGVPAKYAIAKKLLEDDELLFIYPEGANGTAKPFSMRYHLCDFDSGFVKAAIATSSPIIPIITVGGDEVYPLLANFKSLARVMGMPYWPVTPLFPWMPFITSCIPLPIKFLIKIGKPIYLNYPPERATDKELRLGIAKEIQFDIQRELDSLLLQRKSLFAGW